jgi:hypothetical protein
MRRWARLGAGWILLAGLAWGAFAIASARHLPDTLFAAVLDMLGFAAVGFLLFAHALALLAHRRPDSSDIRSNSTGCDGKRTDAAAGEAEPRGNESSEKGVTNRR